MREMEQDPKGYPDQLWKAIIDLGWTGIAFPQKYGGTEGSFVDLAVLVEEMGRALAPSPFFSTVVMAGMTILEAGSEAQKDEFLTKICQGQETFAFAVTEPSATYEAWGIETEAAQDGDGFTLNGTKLFVPDAHTADNIVVAARTTKGSNPEDGITLFIVPRLGPGHIHRDAQHRGVGQAGRSGPEQREGHGGGCLGRSGQGVADAEQGHPARRRRQVRGNAGRRRSSPGHDPGVRQAEGPVRTPHRLVPGRPAPLRQHGHLRRVMPLHGLPGGMDP